MSNPEHAPHRCDEAISRAREQLVGLESGGMSVAGVLHYGAVDLDPGHLVVWLLLAGDPAAIPEWFEVSPRLEPTPRPDGVDLDWLLQLRDVVVRELEGVSWPDASDARVMVDSERRVRDGGGWSYFR